MMIGDYEKNRLEMDLNSYSNITNKMKSSYLPICLRNISDNTVCLARLLIITRWEFGWREMQCLLAGVHCILSSTTW